MEVKQEETMAEAEPIPEHKEEIVEDKPDISAEDCKPEPMETEEKKDVKPEIKEEDEMPGTPAAQSSPTGQSKKKSGFSEKDINNERKLTLL
ncbi:unnamed protein product [Ranitomeya imitator]|uniref:Uncharacterized protein n=1 Tax=Ranitomeya imitator TaxID=111125 RepID=A0ABN9M3N8_9NEOB|nr:unnamed protein product [Ranitomeya imitator]